MTNNQTVYVCVGGPRDGERIVLQPGQTSYTVMILHDPKLLAQLYPDDPLPTTAIVYTARPLLTKKIDLAVLAPDFYSDDEVMLALVANYRVPPVVESRP